MRTKCGSSLWKRGQGHYLSERKAGRMQMKISDPFYERNHNYYMYSCHWRHIHHYHRVSFCEHSTRGQEQSVSVRTTCGTYMKVCAQGYSCIFLCIVMTKMPLAGTEL